MHYDMEQRTAEVLLQSLTASCTTNIETISITTKSMDIRDFAKRFPDRMDAVRDYLEGEGVKMDIGRIASSMRRRTFGWRAMIRRMLDKVRERLGV